MSKAVVKTDLKKSISSRVAKINTAVEAFRSNRKNLTPHLENLKKVISLPITDDVFRNNCMKLAKEAKKAIAVNKEMRLNVTRVIDEIKSNIMDYEKEGASLIAESINEIEVKIAKYDREAEQARQAELERLEAEKEKQRKAAEAKAESLRLMQEKVKSIRSYGLEKLDSITVVSQDSIGNIKSLISTYKEKSKDMSNYKGFTKEAKENFKLVLSTAAQKLSMFQSQLVVIKEENAENQALLERQKIEQKAIDTERRKKEAALEKAEKLKKEAQEKKAKQQAAESRAKIAEAKRQKLKYINTGFKVELIDIEEVPIRFINKTLNIAEVKKEVKKTGEPVSGVKIILADGEELK